LIRSEELQLPNGARYGMTKFSDLSTEEFRSKILDSTNVQFTPIKTDQNAEVTPHHFTPNPVTWSWDSEGACTPVKQLPTQCGASWATAVVETVESYYFLAGYNLTALSTAEVVDCDGSGEGCEGGLPESAYQTIVDYGLVSEAEYPNVKGECNFNENDVITRIAGFTNASGDEEILYKQLSEPGTGGPLCVCVDASEWLNYEGGVLTQCGNDIDHCVELVGYTNYGKTGAYWIVRNAWGPDFGENGYIYIAIGNNLCGIADMATYPTGVTEIKTE